MIKLSWEELHRQFGVHYNSYSTHYIEEKDRFRMVIMTGKRKNVSATFVAFYQGWAVLLLDGEDKEVRVAYRNVERANPDGTPQISQPVDMLRQPVNVGCIVAYAKATTYSAAFKVGRVVSITPIGNFSVRPLASDGIPTNPNGYRAREGETVTSKRCLRLPVDEARLTMAIMTDFASITDDHNG